MSWTAPNAVRYSTSGGARSYRQANACVNGHTTGGGYSFASWARSRGWSAFRIARLEAQRRPPERLMVEPLRAADELASAA